MNSPEEIQPGDFYKTPDGYVIFTEQYLRRRGFCCKNSCKHCPYGFNPRTGLMDSNYINPNNKN